MQRLRQARFLARLVLAWFTLAIGAAVASPAVQPRAAELVCSGGVMKLLVQGDDGEPAAGPAFDCPLCTTAGAPPHAGAALAVAAPAPAAVPAPAAAPPAARSASPLPARGPPAPASA